MQINVPEKNYWRDQEDHRWFAPQVIDDWLKAEGLHPKYCGGSSTGARQNVQMSYIVRKATSEQALLFKLRFPDCETYYNNVESSNV